jgi:hypothetical protein
MLTVLLEYVHRLAVNGCEKERLWLLGTARYSSMVELSRVYPINRIDASTVI